MTTPPDLQLDPFEARLLAELRREVAEAPAETSSAQFSRRGGRRYLAAGAAVAATSVVGVVLVPGLGTAPAYSVQEGNAGEVVVEINRPEDAAGLERALADHGVAADVTFLADGQVCAPGRYTEVDREIDMMLQIGQDIVRVTLPPGAVRDGETFVMELSVQAMTAEELAETSEREGQRALEGTRSTVSAEVATGRVAPCDPR